MISNNLEKIIVQYGYLNASLKIPFLASFYTLGHITSLLFLIYSYTNFKNNNFSNEYYEVLYLSLEEMKQIMNNYSFQSYIILTCNLILIAGFLIIFISHITLDEKKTSKTITFVYNGFSVLGQLLNLTLIIPIVSISLFNLRESMIQNLYWGINDIIFLVQIHIISITQLILSEGMAYIENDAFKKVVFSFVECIPYLIHLLQAYIFIFLDDINSITAQSIMYLFLTFIELYSIFVTKAYINSLQVYIIITVHSCGFIISLTLLIGLENPLIYCFLLAPFSITIINYSYRFQTFQIISQDPNKISLLNLNNLICLFFSSETIDIKQKIILNSILINRHSQYCKNNNCQCRNFQSLMSDPLQLTELPEVILQQEKSNLLRIAKKRALHTNFVDHFFFMCHLIWAQQQNGSVHEIYTTLESSKNINDLTIFQKVLWKIFIIIVKKELYNNFTFKIELYSKDQIALSTQVKKFLESESFNRSIKEGLQNLIQKKMDFQKQLLTLQNKSQIVDQYYCLIQEFEKQERNLRLIYDRFSSKKNQSQLIFFYSEVMQDWQMAFDQMQINALNDQFAETFGDIDLNRLFVKMVYIVFSLEDKKLLIQSYSKRVPQFFGYEARLFENFKFPDPLIPKIIRDVHSSNIETFLAEGKGNYFRKIGQNICLLKSGFLQNVDLFYDINLDENSCLRFISFLSNSEQSDPILLIDDNLRIQGVNKELFKQLNFNPKIIEFQKLLMILGQINCTNFFPSFIFHENLNFYQNISFSFPKDTTFIQIPQSQTFYSNKYLILKNDYVNYEATIEIIYRQTYRIIRFKKIQESDLSPRQHETQHFSMNFIVNNEESVVLPYKDVIQSPVESITKHPLLLEREKSSFTVDKEFISKNLIMHMNSKPAVKYNYSDSSEVIHEDKTIQMLGNIYDEQKNINQEKMVTGGSQASSIAGLRRSIFYRKYQLINELNNVNKVSPQIFYIIILFFFALATQIAFLTMNIIYSTNDFSALHDYYESVQINHYFIEPMQRFFLTRYMLQDYMFMAVYKTITQENVTERKKFIMPILINTYEEFQQNFQGHFSDPGFSNFIKDQYVVVKQQIIHTAPIKVQEYNMTLFNAFSLLLDAFYKQQQIYVTSKTVAGVSAYNTFQYINYELFVSFFDKISDEICKESLNQIQLIVERWITLLIPTSISLYLLFFQVLFHHQKFYALLDQIFDLKKFIISTAMEHDIQREQFILQSLKSGSDLIHKYKFNLIGKEELLKKSKNSDFKELKIDLKKIRQTLKVPKYPFIVLVLIFMLQFAIISISITFVGTMYLKKYAKTVNLFKSFSDIGVYIPAAFSQKEILYFWSYFSYYNASDKVFFKGQVQKSVEKIQQFLLISDDTDELQFSQNFIEDFLVHHESDLCQILNSSNYYNFEYYCTNSQQGILKFGLIPTLNSFNNLLKNELTMDFPNRKVIPINELEAVYLCSDVISKITVEMKEDIKYRSSVIELTLKTVSSVAFSLTFLLIVFLYFFYYETLKLKLHRTKQISYVFPVETLFLNDHFERELRRLAINSQLI